MTLNTIKNVLNKNNLKVWQLAKELNISRSHFYDLSHRNFKGSETTIRKALNDLTKGEK